MTSSFNRKSNPEKEGVDTGNAGLVGEMFVPASLAKALQLGCVLLSIEDDAKEAVPNGAKFNSWTAGKWLSSGVSSCVDVEAAEGSSGKKKSRLLVSRKSLSRLDSKSSNSDS